MLGFFTLVLIAISLSMDTFSLSMIYGTIGLEKKKIYLLSLIVGIFHFFMPLFGNLIGNILLSKLPITPNIAVGIIFILIAMQMLVQKEEIVDLKNFFMLLLFAFTVSIDSFSVGIGISLITNNAYVAYLNFFIISMIFTFLGLRFGKYLNSKFGNKATKVGALMLIILGIFYIFK